MQLWALIVDGFREALDRKIFWVLVGITLLICVALLSIGFEGDHVSFMFGLWLSLIHISEPTRPY